MKSENIAKNDLFVGRQRERERLRAIGDGGSASIIVVYGRRRVGKTELLEQTFAKRGIVKLEGLEGRPRSEQIAGALRQLSRLLEDPWVARLKLDTWGEVFELLRPHVAKGKWTLYLEELQWLAAYDDALIAELKYAWDNYLRHNPELLLVLCGSSPSFMIDQVLHSHALYNRSQHELHLQQFDLHEIAEFLGPRHTTMQALDARLTVGGIPEYLRYLRSDASVFVSLCNESFRQGGFFVSEYDRVFTSSLARNKHYRKVIEFLSQRRFATRNEIVRHLKLSSGGTITDLLTDLELCGFIKQDVPFHLGERSTLVRWHVADPYLQFYYKFIKPQRKRIQQGDFDRESTRAVHRASLDTWLGFAFERFCRDNQQRVAELLGFHGIRYRCGSYFTRPTARDQPGFQWDLVFERDDRVTTLCEVKYSRSPVTSEVIKQFETRLRTLPPRRADAVQRVLISAAGVDESVQNAAYFDRILTVEDFA